MACSSENFTFTSSLKHNGHVPLPVFLLIPFSCHTPASSHSFPFLSFLERRSLYSILPQEKFISRYRAELMSFSLIAVLKCFLFQYYICLSISLLFLSSYTLAASSIYMLILCDTEPKMPTDQHNNKRQYRPEITAVLPIAGKKKFPRYFEGYLEFFAPFQNFCVFISRLRRNP